MNRKKEAITYFKRQLQHLPIQEGETHRSFRRGSWSTGQKSRAGSPKSEEYYYVIPILFQGKAGYNGLKKWEPIFDHPDFYIHSRKTGLFSSARLAVLLDMKTKGKTGPCRETRDKVRIKAFFFGHRILCRNRFEMPLQTAPVVWRDRIYGSMNYKRDITPNSHTV